MRIIPTMTVMGLLGLMCWTICGCSDSLAPDGNNGVFGQIDLPELTGDYVYSEDEPRQTTSFSFPSNIQRYDELRLVVSGDWTVGLAETEIVEVISYRDTMPFNPGLTMVLTTASGSELTFNATVVPRNGEFKEWNSTFLACCPERTFDPTLLMGEEISVEFYCRFGNPFWTRIISDSQGTVTEVRLEAVGALPYVDND